MMKSCFLMFEKYWKMMKKLSSNVWKILKNDENDLPFNVKFVFFPHII